nr:hypothetical protein [Acetobacter senegalensis]
MRGSDLFACSSHVTNGSCTNSRTIPRPDLEPACSPVSRTG